ncbi:MAG: GspH/FimT family pseudopilin [Arenicellales bacterium]|nr:GspH/FimT family pseudopilin [Arenicellales bacterium]
MKRPRTRNLSWWIGKKRVLGTTATEVLFFLLIGAVTIGYAVPNFQNFVINNRVISGTNLVVSALNFARSEAIKRGMPVSTCASIDYANCTTSGWHEGWMVFTDEPIAGVVDGSDEVLRTQDGVELDITLVGQTFIRFAPNGALADAGDDYDEFEGIAWRGPHTPSPLGAFVASLLPISSAYADDDSSSGGGSGRSGGQSGGSTTTGGTTTKGGNAAVFTFTVCPRKAGYKGRSIEVAANGQIRTVEATCTS